MKIKCVQQKSEQEFAEQKFKVEVIIMNIFRTKVKQVKVEYKKVSNITILGKTFEVKVAYKDIKVTEINLESKEVKIILPLKYKNKDTASILNIILNKMYEQLARKEVEIIMEKIRSKLKFAPEDYKIAFMKNTMAKCNSEKEIIINPYIMQYDIKTVEYMVLHEYCHLKYKTHSKGFWELIKKAMPQYERFEFAA